MTRMSSVKICPLLSKVRELGFVCAHRSGREDPGLALRDDVEEFVEPRTR